MSDIVVEIVSPQILDLEIPNTVVYIGGGGGDGLSYTSQQNLSLPQLQTVRRNIFEGTSPVFTYDGNGRVSTVTYADGSVKTFTYTLDKLTRIDHVYTSPARTYRKDFAYDLSGRISSITESIL